MSTTTMPRKSDEPATYEQPRNRSRMLIGVTLILAMIASATLQQAAYSFRSGVINAHRGKGVPPPSRLANLDSFSLALLLGGLRGPLVMFLWTSSESQKSDRDLESFDTKVEMIRLLQPEFVTVHLFQIWNKIYNVSAQMSGLANKYGVILDGIDYAERVLEVLPNDINIVSTIGSAFADKLGGSGEKSYYQARVRNETLPEYEITFPAARLAELKKVIADAGIDEESVRITDGAPGMKRALVNKTPGDRLLERFPQTGVTFKAISRQSLRVDSPGKRRNEEDTMLDVKGMLLPELLKPTIDLPPGVVDNNGAKLQFLKEFQPFPYGISPIALGYNYNKRAQLLQRIGQQKHVQTSKMVVDHLPALTLKEWADEEWDRARRLEQRGLSAMANTEGLPRELRTSKAPVDSKIVDRSAIDQAIFSYQRANLIAEKANAELQDHIQLYPTSASNLNSHADTDKMTRFLMDADAAYLRAMIAATPAEKKAELDKAKANYLEASRMSHLLILKYYVDSNDTTTLQYNRTLIDNKPLAELQDIVSRLRELLKKKYKFAKLNPADQDIQEYEEYIQRASDRVAQIK